MTEFVLLSDIHGNGPALQSVLNREGADRTYVVLGDLMGLCAYPEQVVQLVREHGNYVLAGNHDKAIVDHHEGHVNSEALSRFEYEHTRSELDDEQWAWMQSLPHMDVLQRGSDRICLTHALPWADGASGYEPGNSGITKRDVTHIASVVSEDYDIVCHGHTHQQYDQDCGQFGHDVYFINPGSLGYEHTYSVLNVDDRSVEHKSVEVEADVEAHIQSHLPEDAPPTSHWF